MLHNYVTMDGAKNLINAIHNW